MKKTILLIAFLMVGSLSLLAQTPIIADFRKIIADAPSQFNNLQKELTEENTEKGYKFYSTTLEDSPISDAYIQRRDNELPLYVLDYKVSSMNTMMLGLFTNMASQYIAELNEMVKSGNYTGEDYNTDDGRSVTEIKNLNNDIVVQYVSSDTNHTIFFYGLPK